MKGIFLTILLLLSISFVSAYTINVTPSIVSLNLSANESVVKTITICQDYKDIQLMNILVTPDNESLEVSYPNELYLFGCDEVNLSIRTNNTLTDSKIVINATSDGTIGKFGVIDANFTENKPISINDSKLGIYLEIISNENATSNISITKKSSIGNITLENYDLESYLNISIEGLDNLSNVFIKIYYDENSLSKNNIDEQSLRIWYYNSTDNTWKECSGTVEDVHNYVWTSLDHFSLFGIFGKVKEQEVSTSSSSSEGSGGYCYRHYLVGDWSDCLNGYQNRTITKDMKICYQDKEQQPTNNQTCSEVTEVTKEQTQETQNNETSNITTEPTKNISIYLIIGIIVAIIIVVTLIVIFLRRKSEQTE